MRSIRLLSAVIAVNLLAVGCGTNSSSSSGNTSASHAKEKIRDAADATAEAA
jgi:hypothetical protein